MRIDYHDDILIEVARLGREAMGRVTASMASRQLGEAFAGLAGRRKSAKMRGKDRREQTRLPRDYRRGARVVADVVDQAAHRHAEITT